MKNCILIIIMLLALPVIAGAKEVEVYLPAEFVSANNYLLETYEIDKIDEAAKRITATILSDEGECKLPYIMEKTKGNCTRNKSRPECWDIFLIGDKVTFIRLVTNNTDEDLYTYAWDVTIDYKLKSK